MSLAPYLQDIQLIGSPNNNRQDNIRFYSDLSNNYPAYINNHITFPTKLLDPDPNGANYDTIDNSGNLIYAYDNLTNPNPNLKDAMANDRQIVLSQQNTIFILGTITCMTLIITAIMLSSHR